MSAFFWFSGMSSSITAFSDIIQSACSKPRVLFNVLDNVLNVDQPAEIEISQGLCESFLTFFIDKIVSIRAQIPACPLQVSARCCPSTFCQFEPLTLECLWEIVEPLKPSGSPTDVIPPRLFKEVFSSVGPWVLNMVNSSLSSGVVPESWKHAVVQPLLKKPSLDPSTVSNYRPISKLPFLSKVLEKVVYLQLTEFLHANDICEKFQSGFKKGHSTETALLRVLNDILLATDSGDFEVLVQLDLSAAFDTVDHSLLISRLAESVGIRGVALDCFKSYLAERSFCVSLGGFTSSPSPLVCGVPQGSVLGPLLFSLYLLPLGSIFTKHGCSFHLYADDTQVYIPIKRGLPNSLDPLLNCLDEVKTWMSANFLHFNNDKTEVMLFSPSVSSGPCSADLGPLALFLKPVVTSLGVQLDSDLLLEKQISAVTKASFYQLRRIAKVKRLLSSPDFETVIHAFITSRLDYCNALYLGLPQSHLSRLQMVQNAAARLLTGSRKREHITPILALLHWLPVVYRVQYKVLLLAFRAVHGLAPQYLCELLVTFSPSRSLRSADQFLLEVPRTKRKLRGDRAFSVAAPRLWNALPIQIRMVSSLSGFKSLLKTHLFSVAFNSV
uniref:Reverse transcriptase domain-containing protein n=1 Tax=Nothobranchius furzeri TaxID=105023 RepID=A0A8C6ML89_NOTFU